MLKYALIIVTTLVSSRSAGPDFREVFGSDYKWAANWLQENNTLINTYASAFHIPAKELKAIVFPELIRYNVVFDAIEIESLKYLYVKEGKHYADFSVGYFQMKPSFAEMVEADGKQFLSEADAQKLNWNNNAAGNDDEASRRDRVKRLSNTKQQLVYLCLFYKICEQKFAGTKFTNAAERLKLFSTCYNAGYRRSYESLINFQVKKSFYNYNYSAVSVFYFLNDK